MCGGDRRLTLVTGSFQSFHCRCELCSQKKQKHGSAYAATRRSVEHPQSFVHLTDLYAATLRCAGRNGIIEIF